MRWLLFVLSTGAAVVSSQLTVTSVAASSDITCLLMSDKTVRCSGYSWSLVNFGTGETNWPPGGSGYIRMPSPFITLTNATQVSGGSASDLSPYACGLTTDGSAYCWGNNLDGQKGAGFSEAITKKPTPNFVASEIATVAAGFAASCFLRLDGGVRCVSGKYVGQDTTAVYGNVDAVSGVSKMFNRGTYACAIMAVNSALRCWGNYYGIGYSVGGNGFVLASVARDVLSGVRFVALGYSGSPSVSDGWTCAIMTATNGLRCFGSSADGQAGYVGNIWAPPSQDLITGVLDVACGFKHTCIIVGVQNAVRCFGNNAKHQLGSGLRSNVLFEQATNIYVGAKQLSSFGDYTCAVFINGDLRCWGVNTKAQLGACPNATGVYNSDCSQCVEALLVAGGTGALCTKCASGMSTVIAGDGTGVICSTCAAGTAATAGASVCTPCNIGFYAQIAGVAACVACQQGSYSGVLGATSCLQCPIGTSSLTIGATSIDTCIPCLPGFFAPTNGSATCTPCFSGTYNPSPGGNSSAVCLACGIGTYAVASGSSACTDCPAGRYSNSTGATGNSVCTACAAGKYSTVIAATNESVCTPCAAGKYASSAGLSVCSLCPANTYSVIPGGNAVSACLACPALHYAATGSTVCVQFFSDVFHATTYTAIVFMPFALNLFAFLVPNATILSVSTSSASWLSFNASSLVLSGTATTAERGTYTVYVSGTYLGDELLVNGTVPVNVLVPNTAPSLITPSFNVSIGRSTTLFSSLVIDAEGDVFTIKQNPYNGFFQQQFISVDLVTQRIIVTALSGDQGAYPMNFTLTDVRSPPPAASRNQVLTLLVTNQQPYLARLPPAYQLVTIGQQSQVVLPVSLFSDPDGDTLSLSVMYPSAFVSYFASADTFVIQPTPGTEGNYTITVNASDLYGGVSVLQYIFGVNRAPVLAMQLPSINVSSIGSLFSYTLPSSLFTDIDGDSVTLTLASDVEHPKPSWLSFSVESQSLSGTPRTNTHLPYPLLFVASDARGGTTTFETVIIVPNSSPTVLQGFPSVHINVSDVRTLVIPSTAFSDQDGDVLTFSLYMSDSSPLPSFLTLSGTSMTFAPRSGAQGTYALRLEASDPFDASSSLMFTCTVPNRAPQLAYDMPMPAPATAATRWVLVIDADNFVDDDQDPVRLNACLSNGSVLPSWLLFTPARRMLAGTPLGRDRGVLEIMINATDDFGGFAVGFFNMTVMNSAPLPDGRLYDQQVSQTVTSFTFVVTSFHDVDGDAISLFAHTKGSDRLPVWVVFDPPSRACTVTPVNAPVGSYVIEIVATDSFNASHTEQFGLSIQQPPDLSTASQSTTQLVQYFTPVATCCLLLLVVGAVIAWRQKRLRNTDDQIKSWSLRFRSPVDCSMLATPDFNEVYEGLQSFTTEVGTLKKLGPAFAAFTRFEDCARLYYSMTASPVLFSRLLRLGTFETLLGYMSSKVLEASDESRSVLEALEAANLLHRFLRLMLVEQTGRGYKVPLAAKQKLFQRLDLFLSFLSPHTLDEHRFQHELLCCREAIICMSDTNTLPILAANIIKHILSPGNLIAYIRLLIVDIPSLWYVSLLQVQSSGLHASSGRHELDILQQLAAAESDWRFRFGVASVFINAAIATPVMPPELLTRWLDGESGYWGVARVGFLHLLRDTTWFGKASLTSLEAQRQLLSNITLLFRLSADQRASLDKLLPTSGLRQARRSSRALREPIFLKTSGATSPTDILFSNPMRDGPVTLPRPPRPPTVPPPSLPVGPSPSK